MSICSVTHCDTKAKALGYCSKHYERFKKYGSTEDRPRPARKICKVEECQREAKGLGFCAKHYVRFKKTGNPETVIRNRDGQKRICGAKGCLAKYWGRGYCQKHAYRIEKYGELDPANIKEGTPKGLYLSDGVTKTCNSCLQNKPVADFSKQSVRPDGLNITCKLCLSARQAIRYKDPVKRQRSLEAGARWRERNPDADANKNLIRKYGITLAQYDEMFEAQGGLCALCKKSETTKRRKKGDGRERLAVDHCHDTGRVRGLLCFKCNTAIGSLGDTEADAQRVVDYLSKFSSD